jgi:hypothetical protein
MGEAKQIMLTFRTFRLSGIQTIPWALYFQMQFM